MKLVLIHRISILQHHHQYIQTLYRNEVSEFIQDGNNLILKLKNGKTIVVKNFFIVKGELESELVFEDTTNMAWLPYLLGAAGAIAALANDSDSDNTTKNNPPSVVADKEKQPAITGENKPKTGNITDVKDPDGDQLTYKITTQPKNGTVTIDPKTGEYTYTPNKDFHGDDTFTVTVDDGKGGSTTIEVPVSVIPAATVEVTGYEDNVGNDPENIASGKSTNDNKPVISGISKNAKTVEVTITDVQGKVVKTLTVPVNKDGKWSTPELPEALKDGDYTITAKAKDELGNEVVSKEYTVTVDTTVDAGKPEIVTDLDGSSTITTTVDPKDVDNTGIKVIDPKTGKEIPDLTVTGPDADGKVVIEGKIPEGVEPELKVTDKVGNEVTTPITDKTPAATVSVDGYEDNVGNDPENIASGESTNDNTPVISGTATNAKTVDVYIDGKLVGTAIVGTDGKWALPESAFDNAPLGEGEHTITAKATNGAGKEITSGKYTVIVDTDAPKAEVTIGKDGTITLTYPKDTDPTSIKTDGVTVKDKDGNLILDKDGNPIDVDFADLTIKEDGKLVLTGKVPAGIDGDIKVEVPAGSYKDGAGNSGLLADKEGPVDTLAEKPNLSLEVPDFDLPPLELNIKTWSGLDKVTIGDNTYNLLEGGGNGMPPETLKTVFEYLLSAEGQAAHKPKTDGTTTSLESPNVQTLGGVAITGYVYLEAGHTYQYTGKVDDSGMLIIGNSDPAYVSWAGKVTGVDQEFTVTESGFYTFDFYMHNQASIGNYNFKLEDKSGKEIGYFPDLESAVDSMNKAFEESAPNLKWKVSDLIQKDENDNDGYGFHRPYFNFTGEVGQDISLGKLSASLNDTDGSESLSLKFEGLEEGMQIFVVNDDGTKSLFGMAQADGVLNIDDIKSSFIAGKSLVIVVPESYQVEGESDTFKVKVTATSTEEANGAKDSTHIDFDIVLYPPSSVAAQASEALSNDDTAIYELLSGLEADSNDHSVETWDNFVMGTSDFISDNSSGLVINVEDVGGNGITVNTSGKVHSGVSVNIQSKQGQSALVLKGDTTQITQSGNLSSNSETSAVVELKDLTSTQDINFTNLGSIKVSNDVTAPAGLVAINANIGKNINLTNGEIDTSKGEISGVVALGDQKNQVTLFGGSKADVITATAGETSIMLKDVQRSQSDQLFNKLSAGNGANDSLELSATSNLPNKGSHYALTQAKADEIKGFEQLKIHANSTFELDNSDITLNESAPNGGIHLEDATGTLFVNQSQATGKNTFNHNLYGNGVVKTDINGQDFAFDAAKANLIGEKFTGKLQLENAVFNLKNENTKALTNATLSIGQKAQTIVEEGIGKQSIGGLALMVDA